MNAWTPSPLDASPTDALPGAGGESVLIDQQLRMLDRLAQAGLDIVEAIRAQAVRDPAPDAPPAPLGDLALAYARASRAVRMSIALQSRLVADRREQRRDDATAARMAAVRDRPARRARIERIVERLAQAEHDDDEAVERCRAEAAERLDDADVFGDVLDRPVSETIALICRDLGLFPDWPALAQEAWAREEIAGGDIGAPLRAALSLPVIPETAHGSGLRPARGQAPRLSGTQQRTSEPHSSPSPQGASLGSSPPPQVRDG